MAPKKKPAGEGQRSSKPIKKRRSSYRTMKHKNKPSTSSGSETDSRLLKKSKSSYRMMKQKNKPSTSTGSETDARLFKKSKSSSRTMNQKNKPSTSTGSETDARLLRKSKSSYRTMKQKNKPSTSSDSETDARPLKKSKRIPTVTRAKVTPATTDFVPAKTPDPGCTRDAEEYNMKHPRRGAAIIFNHMNFRNHGKRLGTERDCAELANALDKLGFNVLKHEDCTRNEITGILARAADEDHSDADCLLVAVMTHGSHGYLSAKDVIYPEEMLWEPFVGNKCPTLVGKPKIFIVEACRGGNVDKGVVVCSERDSGHTYSIPVNSDILIAYATINKHPAIREPNEGSWFIQALVLELREHGREKDLLSLLTFTSRRVAVERVAFAPEKPDLHQSKQIPAFVSMLTRLVYFR